MSKRRIFVALSVEKELGATFHEMLRKLKVSGDKKELHVKWSPLQNLHLTLKFLGEIDDSQLSRVTDALSDISRGFEPFSLQLHGLGGFPDEKHARTLWMGVKNKRPLRELQHRVEESLIATGFPAAEYEFRPHITLGRLRNKKNIEDFISPFVRKDFGSIPVRWITLYESFLQGHFPVYKVIQEF